MSGFTSFAVAGGLGGDTPASRGLGQSIVRELLKKGLTVKVLARPESAEKASAQVLINLGAIVIPVDYADPANLEAALQGVDVVISALNGPGLGVQLPLADAAKKAGVKLFIPSEFGSKTDILPPTSVLYGKQLFQKHLKSINLPYVLIFNGSFAEFYPWFIQLGDGTAKVVGDGTHPMTFTFGENIAQFLVSILTKLPIDQLSWSTFPISGSAISLRSLISLIEAKSQRTVAITSYTPEEAMAEFEKTGDFYYAIRFETANEKGLIEGTRNDAAPEVEWVKVVDLL